MRLLNLSLSYFSILIILSACGKGKKDETPRELNKTYLKINLDKNIRSLIPTSDGNQSEKFLYKQLYEPLFSHNKTGKSINQLIDQVSVDSEMNTYTFSLQNNRTFSDGQQLNTKDIRKCFLRLFARFSTNKIILSFKQNIVGYSSFKKSNPSGDQQEILPIGIKIINDFTFSLATKILDPQLLNKLSNEEFYIYRLLESGKSLGSGPFAIDYSNDDINFTLKRNPNYIFNKTENVVSGINIRFIKNSNALLDEFLNESIDVIYCNSFNRSILYLNSLTSQKYGLNNYTEQDSATLQYITFHNFNNTTEINLLINELDLDSTLTVYSKDLTHAPNNGSSRSYYDIPVINETRQDHLVLFDYLKVPKVEKSQLSLEETSEVNLNESYIVINEDHLKMTSMKPEENTLKLLLGNSSKNPMALTVLKYQHDMIIFNQNLNGFTQYGNWSNDIENLTFSQPKKF